MKEMIMFTRPESGFFISLEGIDGTGKSTQHKRLCNRLEALGHEVIRTREPGGAPGAEEIRKLLVTGEPGRWEPETETLLFYAARHDHVARVVMPALKRGCVVVSDRFADSSRAYQGQHGEARRQFVDALHALSIGIEPDLTIVLDMDPALSLERAAKRAAPAASPVAEDRYERMGIDHMRGLREQFRSLATEFPSRVQLVSAEGEPDEVEERIWAVVAGRIGV